jgi:hypothetical protein
MCHLRHMLCRQTFTFTGPGRTSLETVLQQRANETGNITLGLAVAYVSVYGAEFLKQTVWKGGGNEDQQGGWLAFVHFPPKSALDLA